MGFLLASKCGVKESNLRLQVHRAAKPEAHSPCVHQLVCTRSTERRTPHRRHVFAVSPSCLHHSRRCSHVVTFLLGYVSTEPKAGFVIVVLRSGVFYFHVLQWRVVYPLVRCSNLSCTPHSLQSVVGRNCTYNIASRKLQGACPIISGDLGFRL